MSDKQKVAQRHQRLRDLMVTKVEKMITHGTDKKLTDAQREFVVQEVDLLLHSGDARESSLQRIATQLRVLNPTAAPRAATQPVPTAEKEKHHHHHKTSKAVENAAAATPEAANGKSIDEEGSKRRIRLPQEVHSGDLWAKMAEVDVLDYNREIVEARRIAKKKYEEQCRFLDQQVAKRKEVEQRLVVEEKEVAKEVERQRELWEQEAKKLEESRKERFVQERRQRDEQLEQARLRKVREAEVLKKEDKVLAEKLRLEAIKEQEVNQQRKLKAREEVARAQEFNRQFKEGRAQQLAKDVELDKEHQRMSVERLEKQEREREEALLKMQERQKRQHIMAARMETSVAEKAAEDEKKAQAYMDRVTAEQQQEEQKKLEKQAAEKLRMRQYLNLQILEREKARAKELEEVEKLREQSKRLAEEEERREREKRLVEKQKALLHRKDIEAQMERRSQIHEVFMSEKEKQLNSKILSKVDSPKK